MKGNVLKIMSIAFSFFMLLCFSVSVSAEKDDAYSEAYALINSLNPIEDCLNGDEILTRGEFISAVVRIMNYGYAADTKLSFNDVEPGEELYDVLSLAVGEGLVSNSDAFRPDNAVTYQEAMSMCVRALGYGRLAKTYPQSYLNLSLKLDLDKNLSYGAITENDVYILLFNMLNAKTLSAKYVFSNENYEITGCEDKKTLLESVYDISVIEGIMTANNYTSEGSRSDAGDEERIVVGGTVLKGTGYNSYIGLNVKAYYNNGNEAALLVYPYDNTQITIEARAVEEVKKDGRTFVYITEDQKKYRTEMDVEVIYNGKYCYSYSASDFKDFTGSITLIDNNSNGRYDVVKIDSYEYILDSRVNKIDEAVYDNGDSSKAIRIFDSDAVVRFFFFPSKAEAELADISDGDCLAVKKSKDGLLYEIYILSGDVSGTVDSYSAEDKKIEIGGTEYTVSNDFAAKYSTSNLFRGYMAFKTGVNSEIIDISRAEGKFSYGFLMRTHYEAFRKEGEALIFTQDGKTEKFKVGAKIIIDGERGDGKDIRQKLADYQLVRYIVNADGILTKIDTASDGRTFIDSYTRNDEDSLTSYANLGTSFYFRASTLTFYPYFNVASAVIFGVPDDLEAEEDYFIATPSDFTNSTYNVTGYDITSDGKAGAVVYRYSSSELSVAKENEPIIVVEKALNAKNPDGEETILLRGWSGGKFVEYYLDPDIKINKASGINELYPGDIMRFNVRNGEMKDLLVEFDAHPDTFGKNNVSGVSSFNGGAGGFQYQSGKVFSKSDGYIYLASTKTEDGYDYSMEKLRLFHVKAASVVVVDCENGNTVRPGTISDIVTYCENGDNNDFVVLKQQTLYTYHVIIYKGGAK